ncbi:hypothetical protein GGI35DRAFT_353078 [Trichoderma velutinum]
MRNIVRQTNAVAPNRRTRLAGFGWPTRQGRPAGFGIPKFGPLISNLTQRMEGHRDGLLVWWLAEDPEKKSCRGMD